MTIMESRPATDAGTGMHQLPAALAQFRKGDPTVRLPLHWPGVAGRVADAFNGVVEQNAGMARELARLRDARGFWGESMDGIAALQEIRRLPRGRELPMVAVTAKAMKGDRHRCIEAGAWDCLSKPVDPRHPMPVPGGWLCR